MESTIETANIYRIVHGHLEYNLRSRVGRLKALAKRAFPDRTKGLSLTEEHVVILIRQFYILLAKAKDQIYDDTTPEETIIAFTDRILEDLGERFGIQAATARKYIENGGISENRKRGPKPKAEEEIKNDIVDRVKERLRANMPQNFKDVHQHFQALNFNISYSTARRRFMEWGGSLERVVSTQNRRNLDYVQVNKRNFILEVNSLLDEDMDIIFLDESYIHERHVAGFSLSIEGVHLEKPSGKGRRAVLFGALSRNGWVGRTTHFEKDLSVERATGNHSAGSIAYWVANQRGDYHKNFNQEIFVNIFKKNVLQKLQKPTIIIMDRAPYHLCYDETTFFPSKARKKELLNWLKENIEEEEDDDDIMDEERDDIDDLDKLKKAELLEMVLDVWDVPSTLIEDLAAEKGHKVLYLPQYHPELNAIEYCWAFIKGYVRRNPAHTMNVLLNERLPHAFSRLDLERSSNICNYVIKLYRNLFKEFANDETLTTEEEEIAASEDDLYDDIDEDSQEFIQITMTK